jgi:hypothetical protein
MCNTPGQAEQIMLAFNLDVNDTYFFKPASMLAGRRFVAIIKFHPREDLLASDLWRENFIRWEREQLPCRLAVGCTDKIFLVG